MVTSRLHTPYIWFCALVVEGLWSEMQVVIRRTAQAKSRKFQANQGTVVACRSELATGHRLVGQVDRQF